MSKAFVVHVIDDEEEVRQSTALMLEIGNLDVRSWESGDAFLAGVDIHSGGCALLDLRMPGTNGLAVLEELTKCGSNIAVIMITGHGDHVVAQQAISGGAIDFIEKPYDGDILVQKIFRVFASRVLILPLDDELTHSLEPNIPGVTAVAMQPEDVDGIWAIAFGQFGSQDTHSRGATFRIENGKVFGGGANFVYRGTCSLVAEVLTVRLVADRYRADPDFTSLTDLSGDHFRMNFETDAISRDHFEGRIDHLKGPAVRITLRRFAEL